MGTDLTLCHMLFACKIQRDQFLAEKNHITIHVGGVAQW